MTEQDVSPDEAEELPEGREVRNGFIDESESGIDDGGKEEEEDQE